MAKAKAVTRKSEKSDIAQRPRCVAIAEQGIRTAGNFADMMSALMSDVIEGRVSPQVSNAAVNAGGKLLKVVEMQMKYGTTTRGNKKHLNLIDVNGESID
jgi:hypothetical protein